MKILTLIRHAKSDWRKPDWIDFERPLNKRGKKAAPEMGRRMARWDEQPELFISSPAQR
ncbi:MAG: histidine phosphatase family protein, partial [Desulfuromonadaceae bacterium]|nr:histidine phosphatase family protein [Desulfuromonadaceae bacterium]